ncbi:MAG: DUF3604 domain-containing protein, partial [Pirellulaceae bacterium]|nr:DUF3604 domain-containing protein [Pirellulaceae bacterium]
RFDKPGKFVALPGWEWSGNTGLGGDRNVFFLKEGGPISRSSRALVDNCESKDDCSDDVESLFKTLSKCGRDVMVVPHVGGRYADLDRHDAALEPVVEVHSAWGTFEWMLEDAFRNGYKIGIVANSDGHKGRPGASYPGASTFGSLGGLTCVLSEGLDRQSVWDAYQDRRVYATTGNRLLLDVSTNRGDPMGAIVPLRAGEAPKFRVRVAATAAIERIEIRNAMRVLKTVRTYTAADLTSRLKVLWQGAEVRGRGRQVTWDGKLQLSGASVRDWQPINFWNSEKPCRQVGRRELQWEAITTGGVCGVIVELARSGGQLQVSTAQKSFSAEIDKLGVRGRSYGVGGVGKRISAYRLPPAGGPREIEFTWKPAAKHLHSGSNPIYVCVVQEDGHMAWSSPIYLEI